MIIPFVYNILKRHPALMVMIHRVDNDQLGAFILSLRTSDRPTDGQIRTTKPSRRRYEPTRSIRRYGSSSVTETIISRRYRRWLGCFQRRLRNLRMVLKIFWIIRMRR